jgi:hypothetical protein
MFEQTSYCATKAPPALREQVVDWFVCPLFLLFLKLRKYVEILHD